MRRPQPPDGLRSTRKSRTFFPIDDPPLEARMRSAAPAGSYAFFLDQDLDRVMPYDIGHQSKVHARVTGPDARKAQPLIEQALSGEDGRTLLYDSVRDFASTTARHLVFSGPVTYEIDYLYPIAADSGPPAAFRLELVAPGTLSHHGRQPIQYVPAAYRGPRDRTGMTYVELDPATLVTFRLEPAEQATVKNIISFLRTASVLESTQPTLMAQDRRGAYSPAEHQRKRGELIAKITEPIGWDARDLFKKDHLEPYDAWRKLRFLEFTIKMRDRIMERLNAAIAQAGGQLGFQAAIELEGLPTLPDVEKAKNDLESGQRSIGDITRFALQL
jgi:hypothetical protein